SVGVHQPAHAVDALLEHLGQREGVGAEVASEDGERRPLLAGDVDGLVVAAYRDGTSADQAVGRIADGGAARIRDEAAWRTRANGYRRCRQQRRIEDHEAVI